MLHEQWPYWLWFGSLRTPRLADMLLACIPELQSLHRIEGLVLRWGFFRNETIGTAVAGGSFTNCSKASPSSMPIRKSLSGDGKAPPLIHLETASRETLIFCARADWLKPALIRAFSSAVTLRNLPTPLFYQIQKRCHLLSTDKPTPHSNLPIVMCKNQATSFASNSVSRDGGVGDVLPCIP